MENITKATTKTWYVCGKCQEKMETISIKSNDSDLFGLSLGGGKAFYCDNKDCVVNKWRRTLVFNSLDNWLVII